MANSNDEIADIRKIIRKIGPGILKDNGNLRINSISRISSGEAHHNYLIELNGKKFILRESAVRKDKTGGNSWAIKHIEREYKALKSIEPLKIAPKMYYKDISCRIIKRPFIIIDYIEGKQAARITKKDLKVLAEMLAKLHRIHELRGARRESIRSFNKEYMKKRVENLLNSNLSYHVNKSFRTSLKDAYEKIRKIKFKKTALSLIHGDIGRENIIRNKAKIELIDWEGARLSEPGFDIVTMFNRLQLNPKQKRYFMEEYLGSGGKDIAQLDEYEKLRCFDRLLWAIFEFIKVTHGVGDKEALKIKDPKTYIEIAHFEMKRCRSLSLFPKNLRLIIK